MPLIALCSDTAQVAGTIGPGQASQVQMAPPPGHDETWEN